MRLSEFVTKHANLPEEHMRELHNIEITGITSNSQDVRPGFLFAALQGVKVDGCDFISDAVQKGAVAILAPIGTALPSPQNENQSITVIEDENPRKRFSQITSLFLCKRPDIIVAVTGSNGKTSTTHFARQMWQHLNYSAASLGTIGIKAPGINKIGSLTTPDPVTLHTEIEELEASGITHLAIEASSHGLDQYRLDGLALSAAAFTNLTRDHLDYHETMEAYLAAKTRLFTDILPKDKYAVLNADIPEFNFLNEACTAKGKKILSYGYHGKEIKILNRAILPDGQLVELEVLGHLFNINLPLVGEFQLYNCLCALGLVISEFVSDKQKIIQAVHLLEALDGVRGRLEFIGCHPNGAPIFVDYAHTPDALENILKTLRPHTKGRLYALIGCGGDRDRGKRPMMGHIAQELSDGVIVADDNPRTENPAAIRAEIMTACPNAEEYNDRRQAIKAGILKLAPYDVFVITGKGHEQGQIIGNDIIPFDDATEARTVIAEIGI